MRTQITISVFVLVACACGEAGVSSLSGDAQVSDAGSGARDLGTPCGPGFEVEISGRAELSLDQPPSGSLGLVPEGVFFVDIDPSTGAHRLLQLSSGDGRIVEVARAAEIRLLDAREYLVATLESAQPQGTPELVVRVVGGDTPVRLDLGGETPLPRLPLDSMLPRQLIDGDRIGFETETRVGALSVDGTMRREFSRLEGRAEPPVFKWPHLAQTTGRVLTIWRLDDEWPIAEFQAAESPGFSQIGLHDSVWVGIHGARAVRGALPSQSLAIELVADVPCATAHSDGRQAVFGCEPESAMAHPSVALSRKLLIYDWREDRVETIDLGEERALSPRISGRFVAYLSFPPETDFCAPGTLGQVRVLDRETRERRTVASVTHGCLCCGAYWPPNALELERNVLAWSYDVPDGNAAPVPPGGPLGVGLARIRTGCE